MARHKLLLSPKKTKNVKILFLTRLYYPHIGGVEKHVQKISKQLIKKGHKVTIIAEKDIAKEKEFEIKDAIKIYRIPIITNQKLKKFLIWFWFLKQQKLIHEADIVHAHDVAFWYFPFHLLYFNKPFFITFHGYEGEKPPTQKAVLIRKISEKITRGNICIGDFIKKWYGTEPTLISYGAIEKTQNSKIQITNYKYDCCFIGRLAKDTGIITYLEALKILKEQGNNLKLVICGDGPQRKKAEKFAQKNRLKTTFLGFVKNPKIYLSNSHFAFVSRYLAILEAAQVKKLIFATYDNEIKKDYLTMMPIASSIVINKTPQKLAKKIEHFLNHSKDAQELIDQSYSWTHNQTWEKITQSYLDLWRIKS